MQLQTLDAPVQVFYNRTLRHKHTHTQVEHRHQLCAAGPREDSVPGGKSQFWQSLLLWASQLLSPSCMTHPLSACVWERTARRHRLTHTHTHTHTIQCATDRVKGRDQVKWSWWWASGNSHGGSLKMCHQSNILWAARVKAKKKKNTIPL